MNEVSARRAHTRLTLIQAATRVFATKGIGASVEELCDEAGFTRGAFYSNFSSKTELCAAVLEHYMLRDLDIARQAGAIALGPSTSGDEVIESAIDNFIALWGVDVDVLLSLHLIRLASAQDEELRETVLRMDAALPESIGHILTEAFAQHGLTPILPIDALIMVLRSVYLGSLLDDYIAGNVNFQLLRSRLSTVLNALVTGA